MNTNTVTLIVLTVLIAGILDLAFLQAWRDYRSNTNLSGGKKSILKIYLQKIIGWGWFFVPLLFAAIPVWFVFVDRWQNDLLTYRVIFEAWHAWGFNRFLDYPYYFFAVFFCTGLLLVLGLSQKKTFARYLLATVFFVSPSQTISNQEKISANQKTTSYFLLGIASILFIVSIVQFGQYERLPGLEYAALMLLTVGGFLLREYPVQNLLAIFRQKADLWFSVSLAHVSAIILITSLYSGNPRLVSGIVWFVLAHLNLLRHLKKLNPVYWIITMALVLYSLWINAWWFSIIGDEYVFYRNANWIVNHPLEIKLYLFSGEAVYGKFSYLSSLLQAFFLFFFGSTNFSWRFSSIYMAAISLVFFYDFFRRFLSRKAAFLIVILLAGSHYLMTFGKIGYNNLQALFALSLVLWASGWALQSNYDLAYMIVGMAQGFCAYVFPVALFVIPLPFLLFALYTRPPITRNFRRWGIVAGAFLLSIFPLLLQPDYWSTKIGGTFLNQPHVAATFQSVMRSLMTNLVYALYSPIFASSETHFVVASLMDPITGAFLILGGAYLVWAFQRQAFLRFLLIGLGYLLFMVGATHGTANPPLTRMFMLLPFWAALAAIGILWLGEWMKHFGLQEKHLKWVYPPLVILILFTNLLQAYPLSYRRMERYHSFQVFFLKMTQTIWRPAANLPVRLIFVTEKTYWVSDLEELIVIYQLPFHPSQWVQAYNLEDVPDRTLHDPSTVILYPPPWEETIQPEDILVLEALDMKPCSILKTDGVKIFEVWYTASTSWVCEYLHRPPFLTSLDTLPQ